MKKIDEKRTNLLQSFQMLIRMAHFPPLWLHYWVRNIVIFRIIISEIVYIIIRIPDVVLP